MRQSPEGATATGQKTEQFDTSSLSEGLSSFEVQNPGKVIEFINQEVETETREYLNRIKEAGGDETDIAEAGEAENQFRSGVEAAENYFKNAVGESEPVESKPFARERFEPLDIYERPKESVPEQLPKQEEEQTEQTIEEEAEIANGAESVSPNTSPELQNLAHAVKTRSMESAKPIEAKKEQKKEKGFLGKVTEKIANVWNRAVDPLLVQAIANRVQEHEELVGQLATKEGELNAGYARLQKEIQAQTTIVEYPMFLRGKERAQKKIEKLKKQQADIDARKQALQNRRSTESAKLEQYQKKRQPVIDRVTGRINEKLAPHEQTMAEIAESRREYQERIVRRADELRRQRSALDSMSSSLIGRWWTHRADIGTVRRHIKFGEGELQAAQTEIEHVDNEAKLVRKKMRGLEERRTFVQNLGRPRNNYSSSTIS